MERCTGKDRTENQKLEKQQRILKHSDFVLLSKFSRKVQNQHFVARFKKGDTEQTRLGITVTKRVGNAVARNQLKRYVREFFRRNSHTIQRGTDINIIVKTKASDIPSIEAYRSLKNIFCKIRENS